MIFSKMNPPYLPTHLPTYLPTYLATYLPTYGANTAKLSLFQLTAPKIRAILFCTIKMGPDGNQGTLRKVSHLSISLVIVITLAFAD